MKNSNSIFNATIVLFFIMHHGFAQIKKLDNSMIKTGTSEIVNSAKGVNNFNGGMPNRISMNITVPKQTQGATFGEKVNTGKINVVLTNEGCVVLFSSAVGYKVDVVNNSIVELSETENHTFGEKVNQGLHTAGGALSQGSSLLGGALPGGSILSAAVSSVGSLSGGGGAAAASYAKISTKEFKIQDSDTDTVMELPDGNFELAFVISQKATSGLKDTLKTQVRIGFSVENGVLKTKHDTVKNSISNIR